MVNIIFMVLVVASVHRFSIDGQSTLGLDDDDDQNFATEIQNAILQEIRNVQNRIPLCSNKLSETDDQMSPYLNNVTQILHSFNNRLESVDRNTHSSRQVFEELQIKVNSSEVENLLSRQLNYMTQAFQSLSKRLVAVERNVQTSERSVTELQSRVSSFQIENLLDWNFNNLNQTLQSQQRRIEDLDQNVQTARESSESYFQLALNSSQLENLLGGHLNNMSQTFQSQQRRIENLEQTVQSVRESCESCQLTLNSSQLENLLGRHFNEMSQPFQSQQHRIEDLDQNVKNWRDSFERYQQTLNNSQLENLGLLGRQYNNMSQTLESFSRRFDVIDFQEDVQLKFQNLSKHYENQVEILRSVERKLEEHDQYSRNLSAELSSASTSQEFRRLETRPRNCADIRKVGQNVSDVYRVYSSGPGFLNAEISVYCDMISSNGSWLVFQRREDGSEDFERTWVDYQNGFGNLSGEFWLGNDALHLLTSNGDYKLRVDMEDFDGNKRYAEYTKFYVGPVSENYRLNISGYSGNAGDSMAFHNGQMFSTKDADHDQSAGEHCSLKYRGAWWHNHCHNANLNGLYLRGDHESTGDGVIWLTFRGHNYSLKKTEMKIAPQQ